MHMHLYSSSSNSNNAFFLTAIVVAVAVATALSSIPSKIPAPPGRAYLPFQKESIRALVQSERILLGDEMGLGKTISVIGALNVLLLPPEQQEYEPAPLRNVLILCPKSVIPNWDFELRNWLVANNSSNWTCGIATADRGLPEMSSSSSSCSSPATTATATTTTTTTQIVLMNYDIVEKYRGELDRRFAPSFDLVVCDEAHYLKNPNARRTRAVLGGFGGGGSGRGRDSNRQRKHAPLNAKRLWFLTGSPLLNNPTELYPLLRSIDLQCRTIPQLSSLEAFSDRYSHRRDTPWGTVWRGGKHLAELRRRLSQPRRDDGNGDNGGDGSTPLMIRRTKAQVLPDLPPKRHQLLPLWDDGNRVAAEERERVQTALEEFFVKKQREEQQSLAHDDASELEKKTVSELKVLLKEHKLKVSGKKKELIERLRQHLGDDDAVGEEQQATEQQQQHDTNNNNDDDLTEQLDSNNNPKDETEQKDTNNNNNLTTELDDNNNNIFSSAQSALRSRSGRRAGSSDLVQDILREMSRRTGLNATQADSNSVLGLLAAARHETARLKVPHAIELVRNAVESSSQHKVVVFAFHRDVQTEIQTAFGDGTAVGIMGGDSLEERAEAVRRFQTDPSVQVFVGSIKAAGTGITLSAASHVVFVELDWSPLVVQQAEDRVHRVGQKDSVLVQYLFFPDTIDEKMAELLAAKQSTITSAIDEATGSASWVFDFGKHKGLCVADVAGEYPAYLEWLVKQGVHDRRPDLASALEALGFLDERRSRGAEPLEEKATTTTTTSSSQEKIEKEEKQPGGLRSQPGSYVMTFGKHKGRRLMDIPLGYLIWLRSSGSTRRNPMMGMCVNKYLAEERKKR